MSNLWDVRHALMAGAAMAFVGTAQPAMAQVRNFNVPAQDAASGVTALARQADAQILISGKVARGKRTRAVKGQMDVEQALDQLLRGTGLIARKTAPAAWSVLPARQTSKAPVIQTAAAQPVALASQAESAEADPAPVEEAEDIVVTAARREQRLVDVPMSVSAVTQQEIDRRGAVSLLDLSRSVPGFAVIESGPGQNQLFLRGVANPNGLASLVGVYLDEIPVTGAALAQPDLQLVDLERVEVLRGPQGTLYGQGSTGGTVRFITRRPDLNTFSGEASLTGYTTEHGSFSERLTGVVNLPVVDDVLGFRVSGTLANLGGWIDQPAAGRNNINDQLIRNVRIKGLLKPADGLDITGTIIVHRNKGDGITVGVDEDYNVSYPGGDPLAKQRFVDNYEVYNLTAKYDFGGVELLSSTSYMEAHKVSIGLALKFPGFETFNDDRLDTKSFAQEVRLSSTGRGPFNWVVGGFYTDESIDRVQALDLYFDGEFGGIQVIDSVDKSETASVFGDASFDITERFQIGAGLRYFHDKRRRLRIGVPEQAGTFESVNPRFYASYDLADDIALYANVAKGFRSGGFQGSDGDTTFGPENVWSYELGTKGLVDRFRWEVAAFFSNYKNYQAFVLSDDGFTGGLMNAGDAEVYGIDWLFAFDPVRNLTLQVSGNITETELVSVLPTASTNIPGDRLDYVPDYNVSASAEYRFRWAPSMPGFARVDYNQVGPGTVTDRSLGIIAFRSNTLELLNARVGLEYGKWGFEVFADNILGENGRQDPLEALGFGTRVRPRVIGAKVRAIF